MRPELGASLELDALLGKLQELAEASNRRRYDNDERHRWVIHRLWMRSATRAFLVGTR